MNELAPPYSVRPTGGSFSPPDPPAGRTAAADRRTLAPRASATTPGYKTALGLVLCKTQTLRASDNGNQYLTDWFVTSG